MLYVDTETQGWLLELMISHSWWKTLLLPKHNNYSFCAKHEIVKQARDCSKFGKFGKAQKLNEFQKIL
jgi:hypothetical protein